MSAKRLDPPRKKRLCEVSAILGHEFRDLGLLNRALSHSSLGNEGLPDYERLEFLGDAVLGLLVAESLYLRRPEIPEGELTSRRSMLVSRRPLATVADELDLGSYLLVGRGLTDENLRSPRILADLVEAVLAAIYLDGGIKAARRFVQRFVIDRFHIDDDDVRGTTDPKTRLNQWTQSNDVGTPLYEIIETTGPDHDPTFRVAVSVAGITCESAEVKSKQVGEQEAAARCYEVLVEGGSHFESARAAAVRAAPVGRGVARRRAAPAAPAAPAAAAAAAGDNGAEPAEPTDEVAERSAAGVGAGERRAPAGDVSPDDEQPADDDPDIQIVWDEPPRKPARRAR